jgi:hypothetical protein
MFSIHSSIKYYHVSYEEKLNQVLHHLNSNLTLLIDS